MSVTALVGAQYGSEGKGLIAGHLADQFDVHVRTGAPNAGHTYYIDKPNYVASGAVEHERVKVVARSVPVGAKNINASLIIGPGGILDIDELLHEVKTLDGLGLEVSKRLMIDERALVIDRVRHRDYEGGVHGRAHEKIGSTGEGVGIARMAHIARNTLAHDWAWGTINHVGDDNIRGRLAAAGISVVSDVGHILSVWDDTGSKIMLEGTQGSGLSSVHGHWPYVTSTDTNAGQLLVDAGLGPRRLSRVILVARTFPIRVAGNSGPLHEEISFEDLGVEPERTTVTKKIRRIGRWDHELFAKAVRLNGPNPHVALTFMDYVEPLCANTVVADALGKNGWECIRGIEVRHAVKIKWVGTGPDSVIDLA
jgi:adenylosuccinate synthase